MENGRVDFENSNIHAILDILPVPVAVLKNNFKIVFANKQFIELYGYSPGNISSMEQWWKSAYPDEEYRREVIAKWYPAVKALKDSDKSYFTQEFTVTAGDGKKKDIEFRTVKLGTYILIAALDVTDFHLQQQELRKTNEELEASETRFKALHNASFGGITIHDRGLILDCNMGLSHITGFSIDELIGMDGLLLIAPESRELVMGNILSGYEKPYEALGIRKNGEIYPIRLEARNIPYKGKNVRVVEFRDITDLKATEKEIVKAKERAEENDRLKSAFLANMSHEIRTPMNGILGFAELLKIPDLSSSTRDKYLEIIEQSGRRMLNIINDLIDISRIESGQTELNIESFDLNRLIIELHEFFLPETKAANLSLRYSLGITSDSTEFRADKDKLAAVLTNLIRNAVKFTEKGEVEFGYTAAKKELLFFVRDTGIGISPDKCEKIFERFVQENTRSYTSTREGAGLGLSISKAFIELMGGRLWVDSVKGQGSTFQFSLPR